MWQRLPSVEPQYIACSAQLKRQLCDGPTLDVLVYGLHGRNF